MAANDTIDQRPSTNDVPPSATHEPQLDGHALLRELILADPGLPRNKPTEAYWQHILILWQRDPVTYLTRDYRHCRHWFRNHRYQRCKVPSRRTPRYERGYSRSQNAMFWEQQVGMGGILSPSAAQVTQVLKKPMGRKWRQRS